MITLLILTIHYDLRSYYSFFFTATAPTEIYTLSLHDALPIYRERIPRREDLVVATGPHALLAGAHERGLGDRKSTRLNSSHSSISYAVFCLKKKKHRRRGRGDRQSLIA